MFFNKKYSKASKGKIRIYLNEEEYDLSLPVKVILNGNEIFNGMVKPTLETMVESCALFYDPERLFPAAIDIDIEAKSAVPTSIDAVTENIGRSEADAVLYDLTGRRVVKPSMNGVYISNGKKIIIK